MKLEKSVLPLTLNIYKRLSCSEFEKESILSAISGIELVKFVRKACLKTEDLKEVTNQKFLFNVKNEFSHKMKILFRFKKYINKDF